MIWLEFVLPFFLLIHFDLFYFVKLRYSFLVALRISAGLIILLFKPWLRLVRACLLVFSVSGPLFIDCDLFELFLLFSIDCDLFESLYLFNFTSLFPLFFIPMACGPPSSITPTPSTVRLTFIIILQPITTIWYHYSFQDFLNDPFASEFNPHPSIAHLYWITVRNSNSKQ